MTCNHNLLVSDNSCLPHSYLPHLYLISLSLWLHFYSLSKPLCFLFLSLLPISISFHLVSFYSYIFIFIFSSLISLFNTAYYYSFYFILFILVPCFLFFSISPSLCIFLWLIVAHCNFSKCLCNASGLYSNKFMTCNTCLSQSCLQVQEGAEKLSPTPRRLTSSHEMYMQFHLFTPQVNTFDIIFQVSSTLPLKILMLKYWKQEL